MVTTRRSSLRSQRGSAMADMLCALGLLAAALLPLSVSFYSDQKVLRTQYQHAVAMEIVDGEMEILVAGEWTHAYPIKAASAKNLPPGKFTLTRTGQTVRLEWTPEKRGAGGPVVREVRLP
jgi:hypothetical protein